MMLRRIYRDQALIILDEETFPHIPSHSSRLRVQSTNCCNCRPERRICWAILANIRLGIWPLALWDIFVILWSLPPNLTSKTMWSPLRSSSARALRFKALLSAR